MAGEDATLVEKVELANDLGVGIYVSIHSNAGMRWARYGMFYNSNIKIAISLRAMFIIMWQNRLLLMIGAYRCS